MEKEQNEFSQKESSISEDKEPQKQENFEDKEPQKEEKSEDKEEGEFSEDKEPQKEEVDKNTILQDFLKIRDYLNKGSRRNIFLLLIKEDIK